MIQVTNFTKKYSSNKAACDNISFTAQRGEITVLLGPNGAGKTTLLKALTSAHYATSGTVTVTDNDGNTYNAATQGTELRRITGFISDTPSLYENFTVEEFLNTTAELRSGEINFTRIESTRVHSSEIAFASKSEESAASMPNSAIQTAVSRVVELCSLKEVLHQKIATLSHGYKQRVNFAQALVHNPQILILDEPATGLDPSQIHEMRSLIQKLKSQMTIVFSTHIIQEAEQLADKILIINNGIIVASGTKEELIKSANAKNLEDAYLKFVSH